jgi:acetyltransferase-like isoleucine patch superfamily enzyme
MPNSVFARLGGAARRLLVGEPPVHKSIRGTGNLFQADGARLSAVELDIAGDRNRITVGKGCQLYNLKFHLRGSDHVIEIGSNCRVTRGGMFWIEDDHCSLTIGQGTTMVDVHIAVTEPGSRVAVGEECMFANDIDIRCGDSHSILDAATGKRINFAENVSIGRHVWVAAHVVILKGVSIGADSVVASGAIVTKSCEPGSLLAGNPAKVIKTGILWKRERTAKGEA